MNLSYFKLSYFLYIFIFMFNFIYTEDIVLNKNIDYKLASSNLKNVENIEKKQENLIVRTKDYISKILENADFFITKIILAIILGFLLSLTPCIFPMIPITMGILQAEGSSSGLRSFLLALSYTVGVSLTFAILGMAVALGGIAFGQLLSNPFFILSLVTFLIYLALSMLGIYDMYIPSFLQSNNIQFKKGSFLSAFIFGALSGTIASPCLSPGLALILSIVINLKNIFLGFILLFAFGVGSALPLLMIGTLSSSINLLPAAGAWMIEIKKIFGFLIFALCFYYISFLIGSYLVLWLIGEFLLISGIWYLLSRAEYDSKNIILYKKILGLLLILSSVFTFVQAYKNRYQDSELKSELNNNLSKSFWLTNYDQALKRAENEHKNIFLVYTTDACPNCMVLEKKVLSQSIIESILTEKFVLVKIDNLESIKKVIGENRFLATPTILIINYTDQKIRKEWQSGIPKNMTLEEFVQELKVL